MGKVRDRMYALIQEIFKLEDQMIEVYMQDVIQNNTRLDCFECFDRTKHIRDRIKRYQDEVDFIQEHELDGKEELYI